MTIWETGENQQGLDRISYTSKATSYGLGLWGRLGSLDKEDSTTTKAHRVCLTTDLMSNSLILLPWYHGSLLRK